METITNVPVSTLRAGANPRVIIDKTALDELTASVKSRGVLQPIIVRRIAINSTDPVDDIEFEIVAGERRFRAAAAAQLETIPAIVRDLTDEQVEEIQLIENLQRADIHPLDEALAFEKLRKGGTVGVDEIATKLAKSRAYVVQRLKLCALTDKGRKAFKAGKLNIGVAFMLARVNPAVQDEALKRLEQWGQCASVSRARETLQQHYMLELRNAIFPIADAKLVPAAGTCTECPKRTGNARDLFGDVESADVCTDPACFESKRVAHRERQIEVAKQSGLGIITGKKAAEIVSYGHVGESSGYVTLDAKCYTSGPGYNKTVRQIVGKDAPVTLIEDVRSGGMLECVKVADSEALRKAFHGKKAKSQQSAAVSDAERKRKIEAQVRAAIFAAIVEKFDGTLTPAMIRLVFAKLFNIVGSDTTKRLRRSWDPDVKATDYDWPRKYSKKIEDPKALPDVDVRKQLLQTVLAGELYVSTYSTLEQSRNLKAVAEQLKIDHEKIRAPIIAAGKPKAKAKAVKKPAPKRKAKA